MTEEEFKEKVMPHHARMMAEALRILKNREEALDCLQDAMTALWKSRDTLYDVENIAAYCVRSATNKALEMLRRPSFVSTDAGKDIMSGETPAESIEQTEKVALLKQAVKLLPEIERRIIVMKALKGLSNEEIAQTTGLTQANVRVLLHRGRKKLKDYLDKHYGL